MSNSWKCPRCGGINPINQQVCLGCKTPRLFQNMGSSPSPCSKCGSSYDIYANHCPHCGQPIRPLRLNDRNPYPRVTSPQSVMCYESKFNGTLVVTVPSPDSERLYILGPGDVLPIISEIGEYYQLRLPGGEVGFALKSFGQMVEVGLGDVQDPLGYIRLNQSLSPCNIVSIQPNGALEILGVLTKDDRLPVVEERENSFLVQLPNKLRGWVHKSAVIRTVLPNSLPIEASGSGIGSAMGIAALIGLAMVGGALAGSSDEEKIRRGVDHALRDRGM